MSFLVSLFVVISSFISTPSHAATEVFRMYDQPNPEVSTFCNRFTKLQLNLNGNSGTATISNHLEGFCEIYVQENKKTVKITLKEVSCGSKIYKNLDSSQAQIEIVDNRTRVEAIRSRWPGVSFLFFRSTVVSSLSNFCTLL